MAGAGDGVEFVHRAMSFLSSRAKNGHAIIYNLSIHR